MGCSVVHSVSTYVSTHVLWIDSCGLSCAHSNQYRRHQPDRVSSISCTLCVSRWQWITEHCLLQWSVATYRLQYLEHLVHRWYQHLWQLLRQHWRNAVSTMIRISTFVHIAELTLVCSWFWAHSAGTYLISAILYFTIWKSYSEYIKMRQDYFESHEYQSSVHSKSLLVMNVPTGLQSDEKLRKWMQNISAKYPIQQASIGRRSGMLSEVMEKHEAAVRELENTLANYLKGKQAWDGLCRHISWPMKKLTHFFFYKKMERSLVTDQWNRLEAIWDVAEKRWMPLTTSVNRFRATKSKLNIFATMSKASSLKIMDGYHFLELRGRTPQQSNWEMVFLPSSRPAPSVHPLFDLHPNPTMLSGAIWACLKLQEAAKSSFGTLYFICFWLCGLCQLVYCLPVPTSKTWSACSPTRIALPNKTPSLFHCLKPGLPRWSWLSSSWSCRLFFEPFPGDKATLPRRRSIAKVCHGGAMGAILELRK